MSGKLSLITGGNSGIGLEAAVQLAKLGDTVVICSRSLENGNEAKSTIAQKAGVDVNKIFCVQLDLADLENVGSFRSRYDALECASLAIDRLILNAGVLNSGQVKLTKQNIEIQFGTNVVGHYKFVAEMLDLCLKAPHCRVVSVSSMMHKFSKSVDVAHFEVTSGKASSFYGESKLCNLLFTEKLNRVLAEKGISSIMAVSCHPGYSATKITKEMGVEKLSQLIAAGPSKGCRPTVLAATDENAKPNDYAGPRFLTTGAPVWGCAKAPMVSDETLQDKVWDKCEELSDAKFEQRLVKPAE